MSLPDTIILARQLRPPGSLTEFGARFRTEADCEAFLFQVRYPDGFVCPRCGSSRGWPLRGSRLTAGTVLHGTRKDLKSWFLAVFFMVTLTPGVSAVQLQRQLGIKRYETTFQMMHKTRSALVVPGCEVLHGEVEVDDTFIGGKDADHDGRGGDKVLVVGAVELTPFSEVPSGKLR